MEKVIQSSAKMLSRCAPAFNRVCPQVPETGMSVLDAIEHEGVSNYQPYWAVRAHLLQRLGKPREPSDVYDRAIGFPEDPAVRVFLLSEARLLLLLNQKICDSVSEDRSLQQAGLKCGV